jgi:chromosome segregation ATPase
MPDRNNININDINKKQKQDIMIIPASAATAAIMMKMAGVGAAVVMGGTGLAIAYFKKRRRHHTNSSDVFDDESKILSSRGALNHDIKHLHDMTKHLNESERKYKDCERENCNLKNELSSISDRFERHKSQLIKEYEKEISDLRDSYAVWHSGRNMAIGSQMNAKEQEEKVSAFVNSMLETADSACTALENLERSVTRSFSVPHHNHHYYDTDDQKYLHEIDVLRRRLEESSRRESALSEENAKLIEYKQNFNTRLSDLMREIKELTDAILQERSQHEEILERNRQKIKKKKTVIEEQQKQINALQQQLQTQQDEGNQERHEFKTYHLHADAELQQTKAELQQTETQLQQVREELNQAHLHIQETAVQWEQHAKDFFEKEKNYNDTLRQNTHQIAVLEKSNMKLSTEVGELNQYLAENKDYINSLTQTNETQTTKLVQAAQTIQQIKSENAELMERYKTLLQQHNDLAIGERLVAKQKNKIKIAYFKARDSDTPFILT